MSYRRRVENIAGEEGSYKSETDRKPHRNVTMGFENIESEKKSEKGQTEQVAKPMCQQQWWVECVVDGTSELLSLLIHFMTGLIS